jgi:hypothetical protein
MNKELPIALTKQACQICWKTFDRDILIHQNLLIDGEQFKKQFHGKVTGFLDYPCDECKTKLNEKYLPVIIIDPEKSTVNLNNRINPGNEYRMYPVMFVKIDALSKIFEEEIIDEVLQRIEKDRFLLIDEEASKKIGLIDYYEKMKKNPD